MKRILMFRMRLALLLCAIGATIACQSQSELSPEFKLQLRTVILSEGSIGIAQQSIRTQKDSEIFAEFQAGEHCRRMIDARQGDFGKLFEESQRHEHAVWNALGIVAEATNLEMLREQEKQDFLRKEIGEHQRK